MNDYSSLRKKNTVRTVSVIMALLVLLVSCSAAVVVSRIAAYSSSARDIISLTEGGEHAKLSLMDGSTTSFSIPHSVVDPDSLFNSGNSYDVKNSVWSTDTAMDLFKPAYAADDSAVGEYSVYAGGDVIAPGTKNTYHFTLKNTGDETLDYLLYISVKQEGYSGTLPIRARLKGKSSPSTLNTDLITATDLNGRGETGELDSGRQVEYELYWEWPFDGDDAKDTEIGNLAANGEIKLTVEIKTVAWSAI